MNEKSFGNQLKILRRQKNMTQKDLAQKIGIGQTAVANYENGNRFPDEKMLIKISDFFQVTIDQLFGKPNDNYRKHANTRPGFEYKPSRLKEKCEEFITNSFKSTLTGTAMIKNLLETGYSEEQLMLDLLEPSLTEAGKRWEQGLYNEAMEHQLSNTVIQAMMMMQAFSGYIKPGSGKAVCLTPSGESHNIGLRIINRFLEIDGWNSFFLGSSVPAQSLKDFIRDNDIDLVLISLTLNENSESACSLIRTVKSLQDPPSIIAGGLGLKYNEKNIKEAGADYIADNISNTISFTRQLKMQNSNKKLT